ncbi:NUDIX domain-containing protein [bacterium]|nr:NUDIX domain-containing protein [bacterium]
MIATTAPNPSTIYPDRFSSYGILKNDKGEIAITEMLGWGLILPGGKIENDENPEIALRRETQEEIGYNIKSLEFYKQVEAYCEIEVRGKLFQVHNIASIFIGEIGSETGVAGEEETQLHWMYPKETIGKMRLEFQNVVLEELFK